MKRRIIVIEDEPIIAESIRLMVSEIPAYEVAHVFYHPDRAMKWMEDNVIDLVLLDIDLGKTAVSGLEVASFLSLNNIPFIFVTSYSEGSILAKAIVHNPFGYIVKPFNRANLFIALELAFSRINGDDQVSIIEGKTRYQFKSSELVYLAAEGNYTELITTRKKHVLRKSLKSIEKELPEMFIRTHRNYIVNESFIEKINSDIILSTGDFIPLSRTYRVELSSRFTME